MAEHIAEIIEHSGTDKEIDAGALDMLMDNVQISQYSYPVKSTIREIVSNGVDSINEKKTARAILMRLEREEDHYYVPGTNPEMDEAIKANPGVYKNSRFDPDYYNLDYLSDNDRVSIDYFENGNSSKDTLVIRDNGVGLGDYRLHGYLKIGWSSKRLAKRPLGKFGIGAKSPLSMGVNNFEVISVHNGRRFKFMVYSTHYDSIVPPFNYSALTPITGGEVQDNEYIHFYKDDGTPVMDKVTGQPKCFYWEPTTESNYLEVRIQCKKHHKTEVQNAVQSQLLYFSNVDFTIIAADGSKLGIPVQAPKLYEDDYLIISENNQFSRPHIVINNVCYGYIDWEDLELEAIPGNVGVKVGPNEVSITPNREMLRWDEFTRATILRRLGQAKEAAAGVVADNLDQTDFMDWFQAANAIIGWRRTANAGQTTGIVRVLSEMRMLTKQSDSHPEFKPVPGFRYSHLLETMFPGLTVRKITLEVIPKKKRQRKTENKITRNPVWSVDSLFEFPVYIQDGNSSNKKDRLMLEQLHPSGFIVIRNDTRWLQRKKLGQVEEVEVEEMSLEEQSNANVAEWLKQQRMSTEKYRNDPTTAADLLLHYYPSYDTLEISELDKPAKLDELTPEEKRRLEKRIVLSTPGTNDKWVKAQPRIMDLENIDKDLYFGYSPSENPDDPYNQDQRLMKLIKMVVGSPDNRLGNSHGSRANTLGLKVTHGYKDETTGKDVLSIDWHDTFAIHWAHPDTPVMLARISRENTKYFAEDFYHVTEFFNRFEEGTITMSDALIKWNTARLLIEKLKGLEFIKGLGIFTPEIQLLYIELTQYISTYYKQIGSGDLETAIKEHLDMVTDLQLFIRNNPDDEDAKQEVIDAMFGDDPNKQSIKGARAVELELLDKADEIIEFIEPMKPMLAMIDKLDSTSPDFTQQEEEALRQYIQWRTT